MKNNNVLSSWFKENAWNLLITLVAIISAFTIFKTRLEAVENKVSQYPSQDWFELRFQNIDDNFGIMGTDLKELRDDFKVHIGQ